MEIQETLKWLREIANEPAYLLGKEDRSFITKLGNKYGVTVKRKNCASCYVDAAVELFGILSKQMKGGESEPESGNRKYVLKAGTRIIYNGIHVNEATLTDTLAAVLIANGLSTEFFSKLPANEN